MDHKARVLDKEDALDTAPRCVRCDARLLENESPALAYGRRLCQKCATMFEGAQLDGPITIFLSRGYFMMSEYTQGKGPSWRIRVEVRSRSQVDLASIKARLRAGRIYKHTGSAWRWSASSMEDVHKIGQALMQFQPELGMILTAYVAQPDRIARSAFAEAIALKFGTQSIRILKYLTIGDSDGELGENAQIEEPNASSPGQAVPEKEAE